MAVANGMRSVVKARPTLCDVLPKELDTEIPAKPRRSISRAVSSAPRRRPGSAIRLRAGKAPGIADAPLIRISGLIIARAGCARLFGAVLPHAPPRCATFGRCLDATAKRKGFHRLPFRGGEHAAHLTPIGLITSYRRRNL